MKKYPNSECPVVTRRKFLSGLGASAATVVIGGYAISIYGNRKTAPAVGTASSPSTSSPTVPVLAENRTLVVIEMGGGNDGLNTVVPHSLGTYYDLRGNLAVEDTLDLDGAVGLHPNLTFLADLYRQGDVAVIEGVGYPNPDLSHFESMTTWWSAGSAPDGAAGTGWLGRYLDLTAGTENPLAAVVIGPGPNPAVLGSNSFAVTIQDATGLTPHLPQWIDEGDELLAMWSGFAPSSVDSPALLGQVYGAIANSSRAAGSLSDILTELPDPRQTETRNRRELVDSMTVAAALINSDVAPQVIYVHGFGDFDTHDNQANRQGDLMTELNSGLEGFYQTLDDGTQALVMTTSEFGRRAASNGSGTDHGTASTQFVIGSPVLGGRYGLPVDLGRLDVRGNPIHTLDFRSTYATVLDRWLAVDHHEVLSTGYELLPFL